MSQSINIREILLDLLMEIEKSNIPSHIALNQMLTKYQYLDKKDRSFLSRVYRGTLEYRIRLDYVINLYSKVKVNKQKPLIRSLLRMSVYQILFMDSVPDGAVCNEAVKLAVKRGFAPLRGFVNGVLREICRQADAIPYPEEAKDPLAYLQVMYAMPAWIIGLWSHYYPADTVKAMCAAALEPSELTVRCIKPPDVASMEETVNGLCHQLAEQGIEARPAGRLPYALHLTGVDFLNRVESFRTGQFVVQDLSSMLVVEAAGIKPGDTIIDVCAAPGGKSLHAASKLDGKGQILARDLTEKKVDLIRENILRTRTELIRPQVCDACVSNPEDAATAQVVLADLPCSGLGVMGRKPDIKDHMTLEKMDQLVLLQREILSVVWEYVVPDGTLIYSTCTVNPHENIGNVQWFTENYPFELCPLTADCFDGLEDSEKGYIQLLPGIHGCDGFFLAKLRRKHAVEAR